MYKRHPGLMAPEEGESTGGATAEVQQADPQQAEPTSALASAAATTATTAAPAPADPNAWLPEKHRVLGQDGKTLDLEASARKVAEAYGHLEKRLGSGDAPPKSADEYKINVPEALADKIKAEDLQKDAGFKDFIGKLHAAGASQALVDATVAEMLQRGMSMRESSAVLSRAEHDAAVRAQEGWKSDQEYAKQMGNAWHAAKTYSANESDFAGIIKDYGNDPRITRLLANVGAELQEDRPVNPDEQAAVQESMDALMNSRAYLNANDPLHQSTVDKVNAMSARLVGTKPVASGKTMSFRSG